MTMLNWNKPEKIRTKQEWEDHSGFCSGPTGGYVPNMSEQDRLSWKAKWVGKTTAHPQVEIRRGFGGSQLLLIVSMGEGYTYKGYKPKDPTKVQSSAGQYSYATHGVNVHLAANGGIQMTFDELNELHAVVQEARTALEALKNKDV